jgi:hypothetical protein
VRFAMITMLVLSCACAALYGAETKNIDRTLPLSATGSVSLDTHNGSIQVETWDRPQIDIHARIEAAGTSAEDVSRFEATTVEVTSASDSVRISSKYPDLTWAWFGSNPGIHYTITAPRTAHWTIHDHNSQAEIHNVNAALNLDTHNGSLRVVNLGGPLELSAHNGSINVDFGSFQGANITVHNGSVELAMPSTSKFDLRTDTYHALLQSDFPLLTRMLVGRQGSVEGTVNGGGPGLRFSSHNGRLRLRAK